MAKHKTRTAANASDTAAVKSLRQLRSRRERDRTGTFYIEGNRIVDAALLGPGAAPDHFGELVPWFNLGHTVVIDRPEGRAGGMGLGFSGAQMLAVVISSRASSLPCSPQVDRQVQSLQKSWG